MPMLLCQTQVTSFEITLKENCGSYRYGQCFLALSVFFFLFIGSTLPVDGTFDSLDFAAERKNCFDVQCNAITRQPIRNPPKKMISKSLAL